MSVEGVRKTFVPFFSLLFGLIIGGATIWFLLSYYYLDRYNLDIEVYKADIPVSCSDRTVYHGPLSFFIRQGAHRDFVPEHSFADYCGVIETSHGWIKLPGSNWWNQFKTSREYMLKQLKPGCRFKVTVYSFYEPKPVGLNSGTNAPPELLRIDNVYPCDT